MSRDHAHGSGQGVVLDQGIDGGSGRAAVAKEFLHRTDVLAALVSLSGEPVAQSVRGQFSTQ